ncbi:DUF262 domain-containing protein [bacterium]|nr:DUF262 domain-containing protein [bacterium]
MKERATLEDVFNRSIFRIPDYQRGYAWKEKQYKDFWEDLINLQDGRSHYTGLLTLKRIDPDTISEADDEFWLINDQQYEMFHIVDGQQRLTTFIVFIKALLDFYMELEKNRDKEPDEVYVKGTVTASAITERFLYKYKPPQNLFRTYKFGYVKDTPSDEFFRYDVLDEEGPGTVQKSFYTLNLKNALTFFKKQIEALYETEGEDGLKNIYRKLTSNLLFNIYTIHDEFDEFVTFETMNNRGKKLSDLELLKNRLIYLTTLYGCDQLKVAELRKLRERINDTWKEVYYQLGRNPSKPLNDDDFLRAHWIMYFTYSRKTGQDYIQFLLDKYFSPQQVHEKVVIQVELEEAEEQRSGLGFDDDDDFSEQALENSVEREVSNLTPENIRDYVNSLKESAQHWFCAHYPRLANSLPSEEIEAIEKLNRIGMGYFPPLVMSILKNVSDSAKRVKAIQSIERFIFLAFRIGGARGNYRSSEYYGEARKLDLGKSTIESIIDSFEPNLSYLVSEEGIINATYFYTYLQKKFKDKEGYYAWYGLRYFLYEYELDLLSDSIQQKVTWDSLLKTPREYLSIEHICPQSMPEHWQKVFSGVPEDHYHLYYGSLGNLLLLSSSINSSLQNDSYESKLHPKFDGDGRRKRTGYSDGSHSEIEVARLYSQWGPEEIRDRGMRLLSFMERRWGFRFRDEETKESFLFQPTEQGEEDEVGRPESTSGMENA